MGQLDGKVAIVTGSGRGIGPASANGPCGVLSVGLAIVGTCGSRAGARLDGAGRGSKRILPQLAGGGGPPAKPGVEGRP